MKTFFTGDTANNKICLIFQVVIITSLYTLNVMKSLHLALRGKLWCSGWLAVNMNVYVEPNIWVKLAVQSECLRFFPSLSFILSSICSFIPSFIYSQSIIHSFSHSFLLLQPAQVINNSGLILGLRCFHGSEHVFFFHLVGERGASWLQG
jgi:hypothetical protein